jgi:hypothetical protein
MKWRQKPQQRVSSPVDSPVDYPSGVAVQTEAGVYFIKGKTKFKVFSDRVTESWRFDLLPGSLASVSKFKAGPPLGFRNGTLMRNLSDGKIYLISDNKRRHITNPDVFGRFGFDVDTIFLVSDEECNLHEEGEVLS